MNEFEWRRQLRDLRKPVAPTRDLWTQIEARLDDTATAAQQMPTAQQPRRPMLRRHWLAAASLAALFLLGGVLAHLHQQQNATSGSALATAWKPSDPRLAGAAIELSSAQMELRQALQQAPDSPALQRLLSRTEQQQSQLRHLEHQAGLRPRNTPMKSIRYLPMLLILPTAQALADSPLKLSHPATATALVSISNISGEVTVTGWDRQEIQVDGQLGDGTEPLAITGSDDNLAVKVQALGKSGWFNWGSDSTMGSSTLELHVPRGASLKIDVVSASLGIDGIDGGNVTVKTISGKVRINARMPSLKVNSISGGIELAGHAEHVDLQTVSGDILAPSLGGSADLHSTSGRIHVDGGPWQRLSLSTVSGDVQVAGKVASDGTMGIDSMSGDVQLLLPADVSSAIHASSFSGDLRSDFGTPEKSAHGPSSQLDTSAGAGNGKVSVETFSGDLRIRKQD